MEKTVDSTDMSIDDIHMSSSELLDKREIDCGGFGKVYLCCHRKYGLVVLKTVFTGSKQEAYKSDLIQEGKIMCKLNHERVVKLIGVILEDGNYSLVIEYMTKGNLLNVLKQVEVPISVKSRFILEIIEGMIYLHSQKVIHKDLKPENILADDDFHVKIADLGVAAFQKWSTLTKEETSRKRSRSGKMSSSKAGTLSYMAPEHFKDINKKATAKSDVYSFGIVIWVILNNKEPYENVISDAQLSLCVQNGQRPIMTDDIQPDLNEAANLMQECWQDEPSKRPSFEDCEKLFRPVYCEKYEKDIACDMDNLQKGYPAPEAFIERMASLQIDCDAEAPSMPRDTPQSLHSSMGLAHGNVNENLFRASNEPEESEEERYNENLQRKLQEERNYHQTGSRFDNVTNPSNPDVLGELRSRKVFNDPYAMYPQAAENVIPLNGPQTSEPAQADPAFWNYEQGVSYSEAYRPPANNVEYQRMLNPHFPVMTQTPEPMVSPYQHEGWKNPVAESGISSPYHQQPNYAYPSHVPNPGEYRGASANNIFSKGNFAYSGSYVPDSYTPDKAVNLTISNSRAIQIGNNNVMSIAEPSTINRHIPQNLDYKQYQQWFESNSLLNDAQFELLRENLSKKWKEFARKVGFRQPEIDEIDHDYERDGLKEKVFQVLHKWQMKEGSKNATVGKIAKALKDLGEKDLLIQLINLN